MKPIVFEKTASTPQVIFDIKSNRFEINGCSRPEDVRSFYLPILDWLAELNANSIDYIERFKENAAVFKIKFSYFNSSSAKYILDMMLLLNKMHEDGLNVYLEWHYEKGDEDMLDVGRELAEMINFNLKFVEV
ncbi:MAG TPA: DUF1987 domain-containing protein [Salinivirgaceae bacterium]|nr:DUF1987 domain-containing protein [Salinivirgaceae bacterium]HQA76469.1 DUF1987 domain-containing protein [Salinivirgaceae bacterium]